MPELNQILNELPEPPKAGGSYAVVKRFGDKLLYVSGCGPNLAGEEFSGLLGERYTAAEGAAAARNCALNMLAAIKAEIGDLSKIKSVVKLLVLVAGVNEFTQQSVVANGATDLLIGCFGDPAGRPARSAIGVCSLPGNIPVEVEGIFEMC